MDKSKTTLKKNQRRLGLFCGAGLAGTLAMSSPARAASWWLPPNYSEHGTSFDGIFHLIFWLTSAVMIGVFAVMIIFLIKYRHDPTKKKAFFSHGNPRLELIWTAIPAVILITLSMISKRAWDVYRHGNPDEKRPICKMLVIGQQFKWNVIYSGADGTLGRYLAYPRPTDRAWPKTREGEDLEFEDVKGPASLPFKKSVEAISRYIDSENPLGKLYDDAAGKDDNWDNTPGREIIFPAEVPISIELSSKDVIHSFFLPNFRVKLDAVPGLRGEVRLEIRKDGITAQEFDVETVDPTFPLWIDSTTPGAEVKGDPADYVLSDPDDAAKGVLMSRLMRLNDVARQMVMKTVAPGTTPSDSQIAEQVKIVRAKLKKLGIVKIHAMTRSYDLVCEELCGAGHSTMAGIVYVVSKQQFDRFINKKPYSAGNP